MASGHLVAFGNLPLLRDADADHLVDAGGKLVIRALVALEDFDVDDLAMNAMWHTQRCVLNLACLLTEDGSQETLLGAEFGLTTWGDLADQNVVWPNLGTDTDNPVLVEIRQALFTDIRDVARDLFGTKFRVPCFGFVFLDVNRGEDIVPHEPLAEQDGVLKVAALPRHKCDQHVLPQGKLAILSR